MSSAQPLVAFAADAYHSTVASGLAPVLAEAAFADPYTPRYLNRELGILAFKERAFAMAEDAGMPLLERLRYLCIVSSNRDAFFIARWFITLAAIIDRFVDELFPGMRVRSCSEFRVTRNSELFVDE